MTGLTTTPDRANATDATDLSLPLLEASPKERLNHRSAKFSPLGLVLPLSLLVMWEVAARSGWLDRTVSSSPTEILAEIWTLLKTGQLWVHLWTTFLRVFSGFLLGTGVAFLLGVASGVLRTVYRLLNPAIQAIRSVPSYAWVPLFILWFGIFETSKILLIGLGAFFPLYLATVTGIRGVDRKLVEVGLVNDFRGWNLATHILIPASLPAVLVGLRQAMGLAWMFVVAAEFMGATHGLGFLLIDGQTTGRPSTLIASILLFAVCGKLTDGALAWVSDRALSWQDVYRVEG